jgi:hypothetical protein
MAITLDWSEVYAARDVDSPRFWPVTHGGMMLIDQAKEVESASEQAWYEGNETDGEQLDAELRAIEDANESRLEAAKARLAGFSQAHQDDGVLNASQTAPFSGMIGPDNPRNGDVQRRCEFWECAAESAQLLADCE